jgi:glutamate transport system substrate-binding protein
MSFHSAHSARHIRRTGPRRALAILSALATCAVALTSCGSDGDATATPATKPSFPAGTTMARLADAGKITVGTKFDQPGFGLQGLDGKPSGFDVEIAELIAAELGIPADKITFVETPSKVREERIEQGKVDLVVATYTINDKRRERVGFAGPYYTAGQDIMVAQSDTTITGPESFRTDPSAKVCSVTGSTPAEKIKQYLANPASQLVLFDVYSKCADALRTGQVKAVTTDNVILLGLVPTGKGAFKLVGNAFTTEPYGVGIRKGDTAFCEFINGALKKAEASGAYEKAWNDTAGKVEGAQTPDLPTSDPCR